MKIEMRPAAIIQMFWRERLVIEETAEILDPVYVEMA